MKFKVWGMVMAVLLCGALLAACGGGGGGGGGGSSQPSAANIAGTWAIASTITSNTCSDPNGVIETFSGTITHNGTSNSFSLKCYQSSVLVATCNGTISGTNVTISGCSYSDGSGTTTSNVSGTLNTGNMTISGTDNWTYTEPGWGSCSGQSTWAATLAQAGGGGSTTGGGGGSTTGGGGVGDTTAPTVPMGVAATAASSSQISLSWMASTDNVAVTGYKIYRGGIYLKSVTGTSTSDTGLTASTQYCYTVSAYDAASNESAQSNPQACATTQSPPISTPAAPSGLNATVLSSSDIQVTWTDNSTNETGFYLERATGSCAGTFSQIAQLGANVQGYTNNGLSPSQTYCYKVHAYNSAGNSGYSNTSSATTQALANYALTVNKIGSGAGSGVVNGTGINCGGGYSDCTETFTSGTSVTLTAGSVGGATFGAWTGCDSTSGSTCTVNMNTSKMVTASFTSTSSITLADIPSADADGSYALSWTATGLASSAWCVQEAPNTSFTSPTGYISYDTSSPYTYNFSSKPDGTYCYRVGLNCSGSFSSPKCVTVARPSTAVLRVVNNSRYDIVDLRLNGVQKVNYPYVIPAGGSADFTFNSSGSVSIDGGVGNYNPDQTPNSWFIYSGSTSVTAGQVTTESFDPITIDQLLSGFNTARNWDGDYYCYSCSTLAHWARFRFTSTGGWTFYDDGVQKSTGTVTLVSWPNYSSVVSFKLCSTCATIDLWYPFASFYHNNGPADWPTIQYVAQ